MWRRRISPRSGASSPSRSAKARSRPPSATPQRATAPGSTRRVAAEAADILIIGAGMAGASAAAHLAETARVILIEGEDQPGYHSTWRSAALFTETYGNFV